MATMLTASPSPRLTPPAHPHQHPADPVTVSGFLSPSSSSSPSLRRENKSRIGGSKSASPIVKPHSAHVSAYPPPYPSQSSSTSTQAQTQSSPSQARHTSSSTNTTARPRCTSPTEQRSHLPSVRSISTQTSFSPIHTTSRPSTTTHRPQVVMVDAQTQYSPPLTSLSSSGPDSVVDQRRLPQITSGPLIQTPISNLANLHLTKSASQSPQQTSTRSVSSTTSHSNKRPYEPVADAAMPAAPPGLTTPISAVKKEQEQIKTEGGSSHTPLSSKRDHSTTSSDTLHVTEDTQQNGISHGVGPSTTKADTTTTPSKKPRPADPEVKIMPLRYETCDTRDLVILISSMLMELIRYNDTIPLSSGNDSTTGTGAGTGSTSNLTRFHSRAPPGISVVDYLQRLTTYATLSPPILLSMVYYIDRLASFYPAFTISSLTVHRFLITAATVASKGLSDSFWTNRTYARVGGVSVKELALLELEFLVRVQWRIVPRPETLVDYYKSLVGRSIGYRMEGDESGTTTAPTAAAADGGGGGVGRADSDSDIES